MVGGVATTIFQSRLERTEEAMMTGYQAGGTPAQALVGDYASPMHATLARTLIKRRLAKTKAEKERLDKRIADLRARLAPPALRF